MHFGCGDEDLDAGRGLGPALLHAAFGVEGPADLTDGELGIMSLFGVEGACNETFDVITKLK